MPDFIAAFMVVSVLITALRFHERGRTSGLLNANVYALSLFAILAAAIGLAHGFATYAVAIDVRTIAYLVLGYCAGRSTMNAIRDRNMLGAILLTTVIGFSVQQGFVSATGISQASTYGDQLDTLRDITVGFFAGKYGIIFAAALLESARGRRSWAAAVLFGIGLVCIAATFTRTAWLATGIGILVVFAMATWRGRLRMIILTGTLAIALLGLGLTSQGSLFLGAIQYRFTTVFTPVASSPNPDTVNLDTLGSRLAESELAISNLQGAVDWLLGAGFGLSVTGDPLRPYQHNSFAWLLSKGGVIGFAIFAMAVIVIPLRWGIRGVRRRHNRRTRVFALTLLAATIADVVSGVASGHLTFWPYAPLIGMRMAWMEQLSKDSPAKPSAASANATVPSQSGHEIQVVGTR
jgi:hypothetical protein